MDVSQPDFFQDAQSREELETRHPYPPDAPDVEVTATEADGGDSCQEGSGKEGAEEEAPTDDEIVDPGEKSPKIEAGPPKDESQPPKRENLPAQEDPAPVLGPGSPGPAACETVDSDQDQSLRDDKKASQARSVRGGSKDGQSIAPVEYQGNGCRGNYVMIDKYQRAK